MTYGVCLQIKQIASSETNLWKTYYNLLLLLNIRNCVGYFIWVWYLIIGVDSTIGTHEPVV